MSTPIDGRTPATAGATPSRGNRSCCSAFATALARQGFTRDAARDTLWTYNMAEVFQLVLDRGWTPRRYGRWVAAAPASALLPPIEQ